MKIISLLDDFYPKKIEVSKLIRDIMNFCCLREYSKHPISSSSSFLYTKLYKHEKVSIFFTESTIKVFRKVSYTDHSI